MGGETEDSGGEAPLVDGLATTGSNTKEVHEIKVKIPVEQVLRLHYVRMKKKRTFSDVVGSALDVYLDDLLGDDTIV